MLSITNNKHLHAVIIIVLTVQMYFFATSKDQFPDTGSRALITTLFQVILTVVFMSGYQNLMCRVRRFIVDM